MARIVFSTERLLEATQPWDLRLLKTQTVGVKRNTLIVGK